MARYKHKRQKTATGTRNISPKPSVGKRGPFVMLKPKTLKRINALPGERVKVPSNKTTETIPRVVIERLNVQPGRLVKLPTNKTEGKMQTKSKRQRKQGSQERITSQQKETEMSARDQDSKSSSIGAPSTRERFPAELVNSLKKNERLVSIRKRTIITQTLVEEDGRQYMIESRSTSSDVQILDKN